jgi:hypothetical protein
MSGHAGFIVTRNQQSGTDVLPCRRPAAPAVFRITVETQILYYHITPKKSYQFKVAGLSGPSKAEPLDNASPVEQANGRCSTLATWGGPRPFGY